jgi:hypothetical protein
MDSGATYRGTVCPWQCDHVGHMNIMWYVGKFDEAARKSAPFADTIRRSAGLLIAFPEAASA